MTHDKLLIARARIAAGTSWTGEDGGHGNKTESQEKEVRQILRDCADALGKLCDERERLEVQLAGCGVAAMGWSGTDPAKPGDYGWSASYGDVLKIRRELEELRAKVEADRSPEQNS